MNEYVQKQLIGLAQCDTITIDPHKSGFCPYPAGAICYRDERMNNALAVTVQVSYYYGSVNLGDWGLEGSKPGAAAAGVMFANRVSLLCLKTVKFINYMEMMNTFFKLVKLIEMLPLSLLS